MISRLVRLPAGEVAVGDFLIAAIPVKSDSRDRRRRHCVVVEIDGPLLRVSTATRSDLVAIPRYRIRSAWGLREVRP